MIILYNCYENNTHEVPWCETQFKGFFLKKIFSYTVGIKEYLLINQDESIYPRHWRAALRYISIHNGLSASCQKYYQFFIWFVQHHFICIFQKYKRNSTFNSRIQNIPDCLKLGNICQVQTTRPTGYFIILCLFHRNLPRLAAFA